MENQTTEKIICKICNREYKSKGSLAGHLPKHKLNMESYVIQYVLNGIRPLCPICQGETRFNKGSHLFQKYCIEHANEGRREWSKENVTMDFSWRKGLTKETNESIKHQSEIMKGEGNHFFGKHHTEEFGKIIADSNRNRVKLSDEERIKRQKEREENRDRSDYRKKYYLFKKAQLKIELKERQCTHCNAIKEIAEFNNKICDPYGTRGYCRECQKILWEKYYIENKKEIDIKSKKRKENNKDYFRIYNRKWQRERRASDPAYRLRQNIGRKIRQELNKAKNKSTIELIGYQTIELVKHLESLFTPEMHWGNYGIYWEIDHIKPQSLFQWLNSDGTANEQEIRDCWSLSNLQPLTVFENRSKGDKYPKQGM